MKHIKRLFLLGCLLFLTLVFSNFLIINSAKNKTYESIKKIPKNKVGLLLGASKILANGNINLYYKYRVNAAFRLFKSGKIEYILISGDNGSKDYDEPSTFKEDLIALGIPENRIFLDYAGFRTLDSVIRAKEIFGQTSITIISQKFHNERAIYLAKKHNIKAIGYNAKDINGRFGLRTKLREYLARTKAVIDIAIRKKPKFLGKKITIS